MSQEQAKSQISTSKPIISKPIKRKVGAKEKARIYQDFISGVSIKDLSAKYGRPEETIDKSIKDHSASLEQSKTNEATADVSGGLRSKHFWSDLKKQLDDTELNYFEKSWAKLIKQFSQYEVVETDEMIIKDLVIQDILCNRKLRDIRRINKEIDFYQKELDAEFNKSDPNDRDNAKMEQCMRHLSSRRSELENLDKSYTQLQQRKEAKFRDMKSTRDKRFKEIEDSKKTFFELVKILDSSIKREEEGEWIELMKRSVAKETARLGASHEYDDGSFDQPLLTPDTV